MLCRSFFTILLLLVSPWGRLATADAQQAPVDRLADARRLLDRAAQTAVTIANRTEKGVAQSSIVSVYVRVGDMKAAEKIATSIETPITRSSAIARLAQAQVQSGDRTSALATLSQAREAATSLKDEGERALFFEDLILVQILLGDMDGALRSLSGIHDSFIKDDTAQSIVNACGRNGNASAARAFAETIKDKTFQEMAFGGLAEAQARSGDLTGAHRTLAKMTAPDPDLSLEAFYAEGQIKRGDLVGAMKTAAGMPAEVGKLTLLLAIGRAQKKAGDTAASTQTFRNAARMGHAIPPIPENATNVLRMVAEAEGEAGGFAAAAKTFQAAIKAAKADIIIPSFQGLTQIAYAQARVGLFVDAAKTASTIAANHNRLLVLSAIARYRTALPDPFAEREAAVDKLGSAEVKTYVLIGMAEGLLDRMKPVKK